MKMQKGMDSNRKTLIPHQRGVSRNRYTPPTVRVRTRFPARGVGTGPGDARAAAARR
ncbi:hypothetical protein GCM10010261_48910 [Streptomyces pilosus]|nr:hypothetical protein GCM10010261_48910 [Streptomyces pilosus]